jgi:hypothetical protein
MGRLVKEIIKRDGRGRKRNLYVYASFKYPEIFDEVYEPSVHRPLILREVRYRTGPPPAFLGRNKRKSRRVSKYERHVPSQWKEAILRDAPLLKGFFAEEPRWRENMLRWCDKSIEALSPSNNQQPTSKRV